MRLSDFAGPETVPVWLLILTTATGYLLGYLRGHNRGLLTGDQRGYARGIDKERQSWLDHHEREKIRQQKS